jgi:hypothetical protein
MEDRVAMTNAQSHRVSSMVHSNATQGENVPLTAPVNPQRPMNWRFDDILTFMRVVEPERFEIGDQQAHQ